jgi:hemoglobin
MIPFRRRLAIAAVALPLMGGVVSAQEKSLYHRLGGYDAIAAMLDDFAGRLAAEPQLQRFFAGHSRNSEMRQRQLVLDLFCQVTGGPCYYIGRDLKVTHAGLGITQADWNLAVQRFVETMNKHKVGEREQKEVAALIGPLEKDIVEKP